MNTNIEALFEKEMAIKHLKKDYMIEKTFIRPVVDDMGKTFLSMGSGNDRRPLTKNGLRSYLEKVDVPKKFYDKCSPELKLKMVSEFQRRVPNQDKQWRIRTLSDDVRFVASDMYAKFDNIDVYSALKDQNLGHGIELKEHYDDGEHLVIRMAQKEPLLSAGRPFFAGLQISNSEVGLGSVKGALMLWEQICTNGLTVPVKNLGSFTMIHAGENRRERMLGNVNTLVSKFSDFVDVISDNLKIASEADGTVLLSSLKNNREISEHLFETINKAVGNYAKDAEEPMYLDVVSAYTESIQHLPWEERFRHESIAGHLLWDKL